MATFIATVAFMLSLLFPQTVRIPGPGGHGVSAGGNTFTLGGGSIIFSCASSPCTITTTVASGHLLEIWLKTNTNGAYISSVTGGGSWTVPAGCEVSNVSSHGLSCAYILVTTGATSFSLSYSGGSTGFGNLQDFSVSPGPPVLDDTQTVVRTAASTQTMITPVLTGSSDIVFQGMAVSSSANVSTFSGAYTVSFQNGNNFGAIYLANTTNTTAPVGNMSTSTACAIGELAFK